MAIIDEVEKGSKSRFEQQPPTRNHEPAIKSLRRPFIPHNINPGTTSWNEHSSTKNAPNKNQWKFWRTGDTDDSGSFEDTDEAIDNEMEESNLVAFVRQQETELCESSGIGKTQASSRKLLEMKKKYGNRKLEAAEKHCDDKSRIANVRPIMKADRW